MTSLDFSAAAGKQNNIESNTLQAQDTVDCQGQGLGTNLMVVSKQDGEQQTICPAASASAARAKQQRAKQTMGPAASA